MEAASLHLRRLARDLHCGAFNANGDPPLTLPDATWSPRSAAQRLGVCSLMARSQAPGGLALLFGLAAIVADSGSGLAADLEPLLLGEWEQEDINDVGGFRWIRFGQDGRFNFVSGNDGYTIQLSHGVVVLAPEGRGGEVGFRLIGSTVAFDRGTAPMDGWIFMSDDRPFDETNAYYAPLVTCNVSFSGAQMTFTDCRAFFAETGRPEVALPDMVWSRAATNRP